MMSVYIIKGYGRTACAMRIKVPVEAQQRAGPSGSSESRWNMQTTTFRIPVRNGTDPSENDLPEFVRPLQKGSP